MSVRKGPMVYVRCDDCTRPAFYAFTTGERVNRGARCLAHGSMTTTTKRRRELPEEAMGVTIRDFDSFDYAVSVMREAWYKPRPRSTGRGQ